MLLKNVKLYNQIHIVIDASEWVASEVNLTVIFCHLKFGPLNKDDVGSD